MTERRDRPTILFPARHARLGAAFAASLAVYVSVRAGHTAVDPFPIPADRPVYPVAGEVRWRGRPAERAVVYLHPLDDPSPVRWPNGFPRATVGPDGTFAVSAFAPRDGAPAGRYAALVRWPRRADRTSAADEGDGREDRFGGRYLRPERSPWLVEVRPGPPTRLRLDLAD